MGATRGNRVLAGCASLEPGYARHAAEADSFPQRKLIAFDIRQKGCGPVTSGRAVHCERQGGVVDPDQRKAGRTCAILPSGGIAMPEHADDVLKPGQHFDPGPFALDLYRLLCTVLADKAVAKLSVDA